MSLQRIHVCRSVADWVATQSILFLLHDPYANIQYVGNSFLYKYMYNLNNPYIPKKKADNFKNIFFLLLLKYLLLFFYADFKIATYHQLEMLTLVLLVEMNHLEFLDS